MSVPPQGGWQPPQQPGPQSNPGQPHGQQPPPGWQQGWPQQPGPPPQKGNSLKWLLIAVAVLLVVGISVGATLLFTRSGGGGGSTTSTSAAPSDIASANDTGPVAIITSEPTCEAFNGINNSLADVQSNGWGDLRSTLGPVSTWTADQRTEVESVARATRNAADQAVSLAKQTPNRIVKELYEQFIAYGRAYADSIANYVPSDDGLASANVNAGSAIIGICNTIQDGSASRSMSLDPASPPRNANPPGDPSNAARFLPSSDPACLPWIQKLDAFNAATTEWQKRDGSIPASQWTPEQRALWDAAFPLLTSYANEIVDAGRSSDNPVFADLAESAALYIRAFVSAGDNYVNADGWLNYTAFRIANLVAGACRAVGG